MKNFTFSLLCCLFFTQMKAQDALRITQLAHWDDESLPVASPGGLNLQYSGCWGLPVNGSEIAVLGGARHVLFFDVTDATAPQLIGKFEGTSTTVWREFKSYKNRIYAVSDNTVEGLQIFDLTNAPDTIVRTYWSNEFFNSAHTITLDTSSGRIYLNGTNVASQGLLILDVSQNPDLPTVLAAVSVPGGYIHDSFVRHDTIYASSGFEGLFVLDCAVPQNPQLLASVSTGGYNHNSWSSADGRYLYYTEEIPKGRPWHIVDLQSLSTGEIEVVGAILDGLAPGGDTLAIPHNIYIKDNLLFNSQYEDGLLVYDIADPLQPALVAYYDTHPQNTVYNGYYGNWGSYPWLPSGNIIADDMQNGLYMLRLDLPSSTNNPDSARQFSVSPNPAADFFRIQWQETPARWQWNLYDLTGRLLQQGAPGESQEAQIAVGQLPPGLYALQVLSADGSSRTVKVAKR